MLTERESQRMHERFARRHAAHRLVVAFLALLGLLYAAGTVAYMAGVI